MPSTDAETRLEFTAARCRRHVVRMVRAGGSGHLGGAFSAMDIIVALYGAILRIDPAHPRSQDRDRFLLSAGHKAMAQYAVLAERGFFETDLLDSYGSLGTPLPGHPDMHKLPGVEGNTGALGHGLSLATGMAMGLRLTHPQARVFTILGDGELPEGSNWEAAAAAAHHKVDNLVAIVDHNDMQISGRVGEIMNMDSITDKFSAFGWSCTVIDGHSMADILSALERVPLTEGRPSAILAHTVKGQGLSSTAGILASHYWKPDEQELSEAETELDALIDSLKGNSLT